MLAEPSPLHVPCWDSLGRWRGRAGLVLGAFRQFSLGPWNGKQHPEFTGLYRGPSVAEGSCWARELCRARGVEFRRQSLSSPRAPVCSQG